MEPVNKMKMELTGKEFFLKNNLAEYEKPNIYSLETEFAKSKKNRDFRPYLVFFGFILLLGLSTAAIADFLETKSKQIDIDISDFEDLRLKETLNAAAEMGNELGRKTDELKNLKASYDTEVRKLRQEIQQKGKSAVLKEEENRLKELEKQYQKKIAQKQAEIASIEKDNKIENLADYRRYYQQQLKKQKEYYENRIKELEKGAVTDNEAIRRKEKELRTELDQYRDVFTDSELVSLLTPIVPGGATLNLNSYRKELEQENVFERSAFKNLRTKISRLSAIIAKLREIPDSNPASGSFKQTNALAYSLINDYERLWFALADRIASKNERLGTYQSAISIVLKEQNASGCVIDATQREKITVFCRKGWDVDTETIVDLYRGKNEYIGKLKLIPSAAGTWGKMAEADKNKTIKPMDWFRVPANP